MSLRDHQRTGGFTPTTTQYRHSSNTQRTPITRHNQVRLVNLIERIKINDLMPSNPATIPRRKSLLYVSYTPTDEDGSNKMDDTDLATDRDIADKHIVDYIDKNHLNVPLGISSTSISHLEPRSSHGNETRGRKHVAAGQSPDINNSTDGISTKCSIIADKNNNNDTSNHSTMVTHTLFDNTAQFYESSQVKSKSFLTSQTLATTNTPSLKSGQRKSKSNRLSWIPYAHKKQPSWVRGFFDKHRRVNDEVAASNKSSLLPTKSAPPTSNPSPIQSSSSPLPLQLISYLSYKLSIPYLKMTDNNSDNQIQQRRYGKNRWKSRKSTNKHPRSVAPKNIDDATTNGGQQRRRQPLLESDVYRMSHMKLTNPQRSLREQVVIINSMFRYLSTLPIPIKHQYQQQHQHQQQWRLLYHIPSPTNQTVTSTLSSSLKHAHLKTSAISQSISPHLKNPLTASSTTP